MNKREKTNGKKEMKIRNVMGEKVKNWKNGLKSIFINYILIFKLEEVEG